MSVLDRITIKGYRSICNLQFRLRRLNVVRGPNGSGKSNLYKALRLLARTAQGGLPQAIAHEGGMPSVLWAGRRKKSSAQAPVRLTLAAFSNEFNYEVSLGLPPPCSRAFPTDPEVKEEHVWMGQTRRKGNTYFERSTSGAWVMDRNGDRVSYSGNLNSSEPVLAQLREPHLYPELSILGRGLQEWRFYDYFRTDPESSLRQPQPSVLTPILAHDGIDLAAALLTIRTRGDADILEESIQAVFPGSILYIECEGCSFWLELELPGMHRRLKAAEFSDGTLRYLCLLAALLSPMPAPLLVLNEPENSLHPDVLVPLAKLICRAAERSQVWVTTHSDQLADLLADGPDAKVITLHKVDGETRIKGQGLILGDD
jgi:predicted ATPase